MAPNARQNKKTEKIKSQKRREQVKLAMRRHRQKLSEEQLEIRRKKDRERYNRKKEQGLIRNINELTPRAQKIIRQQWKERSKKYREKKKAMEQIRQQTEEFVENDTPPDSPTSSSSRSRAESGRKIADKNKRRLKLENILLKEKLRIMEIRLKKYKTRCNRAIAEVNKKNMKVANKKNCKIYNIRKKIQEFLEKDECSRLTAGKKETITKNKVKKQIRLLNDSLLNLYSKFKNTVNNKISYSLFCRYRPFWIISPKTRHRDTCLCIHHTNIELIVTALKTAKVINEVTPVALVKTICCEGKLKEECLLRKCKDCKNKKIHINTTDSNNSIPYYRWIRKKFPVSIQGTEKMSQKTIKEKVLSSKKDLSDHLLSKLPDFMKHLNNIYHQYQAINYAKRQVNEETAVLHIDFAENYICKYAEEVQAVHFGASKPQISLHTAVLYHFGESDSLITPFCTISENLRHDPVLICNHLLPVIKIIKGLCPNIKTMHFVSDGPSSQYRNKSMFFLMANFLAVNLDVQNLVWHYNETGHGKGSPDGIGATIKRTADQSVARGYDVANFQQLIQCLIKNCKGVQILPVDDENVATIENLLSRSLTPTFKGTLAIHQVAWNKNSPSLLHARKLSCTECHPHQICLHYEIGVINTEPIRVSFEESDGLPSLSHSDHTLHTSDKRTYKKARASESSSPPCPESSTQFDNSHSVRRILEKPNPFLVVSSSTLKERKCSTPFDDSECTDSRFFEQPGSSHRNTVSYVLEDDNLLNFDDSDLENKPVAVSVLSKRSRNFYYKSFSDESVEKEINRKKYIDRIFNTSEFETEVRKPRKRLTLQSSSSSEENIF